MGETFKAIGTGIGKIFYPDFGEGRESEFKRLKIDKNSLFKNDKFIRFTKNNDRGDLYNISVDFKEIGNDMLKVLKK